MSKLAVFDFDKTIVDDDSDSVIVRKLAERERAPVRDTTNIDWTSYMSNVFEHAFTAGLSQNDILDTIASMIPTPGIIELIEALSVAGWDIVLLTDANSVFIEHWLKTHGLEKAITTVITNRAFWQNGRLYIEPYMEQSCCERCPRNLCKSRALSEWRGGRAYRVVAYTGDGINDYCPASTLTKNDYVFPRRGFPLDDLTKATLATPAPEVVATVIPWDDAHTIIKELLPDKMAAASVNQIDSRSSELIKVR